MILDSPLGSSHFSPLQSQVDGLVGGFAETATDWRSLASMMAGGMAYRAGRIGVMGLGNGSVLRATSVGLGLTAEVSTFELSHRALSSVTVGAQGREPLYTNLWSWNGPGGIRQGLLQSFVTFGALKGAGRLAMGENIFAQHLLQDSAMVLGHQVSGTLGIAPRPIGTLAEQFLHAEATNLQIGAGMALAHGFAPGLQALERGLDLSLRQENFEGPFRATPQVGTFSVAAAGRRGPLLSADEIRFTPPITLMSTGGDGDGGGKGPLIPALLSLIFGRNRSTPPRPEERNPHLMRLPLLLNETLQALGEEEPGSLAHVKKREELHDILRQISGTYSNSPSRNFLAGVSSKTMAQIFEAMDYDSPPLPADIKIVGRFGLSLDVRELLQEMEMRQRHGSEFLSHEFFRPEGMSVVQVLDRGRTSLFINCQAVLRGPPRSSAKSPLLFNAGRTEVPKPSPSRILEGQVQEAFDRALRLFPAIEVSYRKAPVLRWTLEFWPPPSLFASISPEYFKGLLQKSLDGLPHISPLQRVREIQVELKSRGSVLRFNFIHSDAKGKGTFIPHEPDPL